MAGVLAQLVEHLVFSTDQYGVGLVGEVGPLLVLLSWVATVFGVELVEAAEELRQVELEAHLATEALAALEIRLQMLQQQDRSQAVAVADRLPVIVAQVVLAA